MTPSLIGYLWVALASLASAAATYLIKVSNQYSADISVGRLAWLGAAVAAYGAGFVCYTVALQRLQISLAYPVMTAITMLLVALAGGMLLQEALTPAKLLGMALIAFGAFMMVR